jgi:hypothetical protein
VAVAEVVADREAGLLERPPEWVVALVVIVGKPDLAREVGQVHGARSERSESLHFFDRVRNVDDGHLVRHGQAVRVVCGEVDEVIGERAADRAPIALDEPEGTECADLGVEHLCLDTVAVHRGEARDRIAVPRIAHRFHVPRVERELATAAELLVDARLLGDRVVERLVQRARDPFADGVEAHRDVRVGRDQSGGGHRRLRFPGSVACRHDSY